ncbi:MAG: PA2779 family protein [Betaproteobacteria bacterium]|nr:PA2779 family protein [Betaproteobacteria bacterium]
MKPAATAILVRLLVVLIAWAPWQVQAGMIGTDRAAASADRAALAALVARADVSSALVSLGAQPADVQSRIAAMSDEEVRSLQGRLESVPAGGTSSSTKTLIVIIIIAAIIWWAAGRPGMNQ